MKFVQQAAITTVIVLVVIFVARKVPFVGMYVDRALTG